MSQVNGQKVAEALDTIAEQFGVLAALFRNSVGDSGGAAVPAAARKRGAAAKKAGPADDATDYDELRDQTRAKLQELLEAKGKEVMVQALESVGAGKLADVDDTQLQELQDKAQELIDADEEEAPPPAKKGRSKKAAPAVTLEQLQEAARALIEADKPAYVKLTKKHGKPSEMDESGYAAALAAYQEAMPAEEEEAEDDLL